MDCILNKLLTAVLLIWAVSATAKDSRGYVPADYSWTTQSSNSSGSMPCGGGSIGLNVWVENGDLMFYAQRSGAFDENNTMLKAGRYRLRLYDAKSRKSNEKGGRREASVFGSRSFRQTLHVYDGYVSVTTDDINVSIWVDVFRPVIHVDIHGKGFTGTVSYESWRYRDRGISKMECQQCSYKFGKVQRLKTTADSIQPYTDVVWAYHENGDSTVFDATAIEQGLGSQRGRMYNPIGRLISGCAMECPDFRFNGTNDGIYASTDYRAWNFTTTRVLTRTQILIALDDTQDGIGAFKRQVRTLISGSRRAKPDESRSWWHAFWQRSHIRATSEAAAITRNYTLFRYMLGCNAYGKWPTKFNGGLFTFDPVYVDKRYPFTPDFRRWGGGTFTAQNQRLVYWGMVKSGDYDMLSAQLDFYKRILPTAMLRVRTYWGHGGANFTEQIENFGLSNIDEYGKKRPTDYDKGVDYNAWLEYTWDTVLEFCGMALDANRYGNMDISDYITMIKESVRFFDEHYQWQARKMGRKALDGDGHLIIYPGSGCETFKMAYNPANTVVAMKVVATRLCDYLTIHHADSDTIAYFRGVAGRVPPIPTRVIGGHEVIAPALVWARINNRELPQLYPVFPWHCYGVGLDSLRTAVDTWKFDPYVQQFKGVTSWEQANIFAADLGLTDEAAALNTAKLKDGPYRFPAFWGPGHDWAPDHNWGGSGMIGLQEMLLQRDAKGRRILKPAWPEKWDVDFKLN